MTLKGNLFILIATAITLTGVGYLWLKFGNILFIEMALSKLSMCF